MGGLWHCYTHITIFLAENCRFHRLFSNRWPRPCRMVPWHLLWFFAAPRAAAVTGVASAAPQAFWDWLLGRVEGIKYGYFLVNHGKTHGKMGKAWEKNGKTHRKMRLTLW